MPANSAKRMVRCSFCGRKAKREGSGFKMYRPPAGAISKQDLSSESRSDTFSWTPEMDILPAISAAKPIILEYSMSRTGSVEVPNSDSRHSVW